MGEQRGKALVGLPSVFLFFYELACFSLMLCSAHNVSSVFNLNQNVYGSSHAGSDRLTENMKGNTHSFPMYA
jgi:hypothetical protein